LNSAPLLRSAGTVSSEASALAWASCSYSNQRRKRSIKCPAIGPPYLFLSCELAVLPRSRFVIRGSRPQPTSFIVSFTRERQASRLKTLDGSGACHGFSLLNPWGRGRRHGLKVEPVPPTRLLHRSACAARRRTTRCPTSAYAKEAPIRSTS